MSGGILRPEQRRSNSREPGAGAHPDGLTGHIQFSTLDILLKILARQLHPKACVLSLIDVAAADFS